MTRTIAVTGGTGFLGAALIDQLLARGDRVKALARDPAKLHRPPRDDLAVVRGALEDESALERLAAGADAVVHCAGLTHARRDAEFFAANATGAGAMAKAAARAEAPLIHVSSIAARAPDLSAYASSKRAGETAVADAAGQSPWIAIRAPAIYGPRDRATLPYFKLVKSGLAPEPAARPAPRASILHVDDVAGAILAAIDGRPASGVYELADETPEGRTWGEIGSALAAAFGTRARALRAPRAALAFYASVAAGLSRAAGKAPMVTPGKIAEFFHRDWVARDNLLSEKTGFRPQIPLKTGFAKTVRWYQENGLL